MHLFYVRVGSAGELHLATASTEFASVYDRTRRDYRNQRVVVRSERGVLLGTVVSRCESGMLSLETPLRTHIIRLTTQQDELLLKRLARHRREAVERCREELTASGSTSILLDIDQSIDGTSLVMHFLGDVDEIAETVTTSISEQYESVVRTRHFAKLLRDGCGPACGTKEGSGCSTVGCTGCAVADTCSTKKKIAGKSPQ